MPFRSEAQRRYLHSQHPKLAAKWERKYRRSPTHKYRDSGTRNPSLPMGAGMGTKKNPRPVKVRRRGN